MFNQNNEEPKLDWMYKGPNSTVDREDYLLGRKIDKTLEQINEEEKQGSTTAIVSSKNRVEHECIPPSIRDFNRTVQAEQVDLSTKLQEDPLVAIKKREEETRRQFLQNPIQLKKLQKALKAQQEKNLKKNKKSKKKKKRKKSSSSSSDSDSDEDLDTILMHKFNELKQHLSENDLRDILTGNISDSSDDNDGKETRKKCSSSNEDDKRKNRHDNKRDRQRNSTERNRNRDGRRSKSPHSSKHHYDSDDSEYSNKRRNYGLVKSDGTKIPFKQSHHRDDKSKRSKIIEEPPPRSLKKRLTDAEKEKLRQEMMENAVWRDKERERNIKRYRKEDEKESKQVGEFDSNFIHKQMMKSTINGSVESRIKSNLNNIQRSNRDMDRNFSKR